MLFSNTFFILAITRELELHQSQLKEYHLPFSNLKDFSFFKKLDAG